MKLSFQLQSGKFPGIKEGIFPANSTSEEVITEEQSLINPETVKPFFCPISS